MRDCKVGRKILITELITFSKIFHYETKIMDNSHNAYLGNMFDEL